MYLCMYVGPIKLEIPVIKKEFIFLEFTYLNDKRNPQNKMLYTACARIVWFGLILLWILELVKLALETHLPNNDYLQKKKLLKATK